MLRYLPLLLLAIALLTGCPPKPVVAEQTVTIGDPNAPFNYVRYRPDSVRRPVDYDFKRASMDWENYVPDTTNERLLPVRHVRVNFHIMNSRDTFYRFFGAEAVKYMQDLEGQMFSIIHHRSAHWLTPDSMDVPALPRRVYFHLDEKPDGSPAVYEHYDDELYGYVHKGPGMNRSDRTVIKKYGVNKDSVLNIFIMGPPKEKVAAGYRPSGTDGIYLGDFIKITGLLSRNTPPWEMRSVVVHEIGHALGLNHAWTSRDGCDDTPVHKNNAWKVSKADYGPGKTSNNLMDYSRDQRALTPCQIGRMHARMNDITSRQRRWTKRRWCDYKWDKPVEITTSVELNGARDFEGDIVVRRGGSLRINSRVHLPERAVIKVEPGGTLSIGPQAVLHNDCGGVWFGIKVGVTEGGFAGTVDVDPQAVFLNERP